jgi:hypothetical protein
MKSECEGLLSADAQTWCPGSTAGPRMLDKGRGSDRVLTELARLQKEYLIDLEDAVVAIRQPDGKVNVKQSINLVRVGAASGGLSGRRVRVEGLRQRPDESWSRLVVPSRPQ